VQDPTPANSDNVQRQLAIFDVVRRARGKTSTEIKRMLAKAFAERGLAKQPGPWMDAVASEAAYGKTYIVDLPAAVAAESITTAPDPHVAETLRERGVLRSESSADNQYESPAGTASTVEGGQHAGPAAGIGEDERTDDGAARPPKASAVPPRQLLAFTAAAVAMALAAAALRTGLRRRGQSHGGIVPTRATAGHRRRSNRGHA